MMRPDRTGLVVVHEDGPWRSAEMSLGKAPASWPVWVRSVAWIEEQVHGGMAGTMDDQFYASLYTYLDRAHAPTPARAAVDFLRGLATWDYAQAARAADPRSPRREEASSGSIPTSYATAL